LFEDNNLLLFEDIPFVNTGYSYCSI